MNLYALYLCFLYKNRNLILVFSTFFFSFFKKRSFFNNYSQRAFLLYAYNLATRCIQLEGSMKLCNTVSMYSVILHYNYEMTKIIRYDSLSRSNVHVSLKMQIYRSGSYDFFPAFIIFLNLVYKYCFTIKLNIFFSQKITNVADCFLSHFLQLNLFSYTFSSLNLKNSNLQYLYIFLMFKYIFLNFDISPL